MIDLKYQPDHEGQLSLVLFAKGNQVEPLYQLVMKLLDLKVGQVPKGDDMAYMYVHSLNLTVMMFRGNGWLYPVAEMYSKLAENIPIAGWSNWELEFIENSQLKLGNLDLDMLGVTDFPAVGNLNLMAEFIRRAVDVDLEDAEVDAEDLRQNLDEKIEVDDAHA